MEAGTASRVIEVREFGGPEVLPLAASPA